MISFDENEKLKKFSSRFDYFFFFPLTLEINFLFFSEDFEFLEKISAKRHVGEHSWQFWRVLETTSRLFILGKKKNFKKPKIELR